MSYSCPHCQKAIDDAIPKARFDEVYEERKTLKAQVTELEKTGKSADKIAAKYEETKAELEATKARHTVDLAMIDLGIKDPEVREALEWQYGKLPAENRAPFTDTVKAWHEKPEEAPAVVRSLLPKGQSAPAAVPAPGAAQPNGGAIPRPAFGRHTNGLEGSGTSAAFQPGSLRAKRAAGTLTQADIDQAMAAVTGQQPVQQKPTS